MASRRSRIVGVGAFERDNFGDLLYAELARAVARERFDLVLATPVAADMRHDLGVELPAAGATLRDAGATGIWVVGGEVGATSQEYVYKTRFGEAALAALLRMPPERAHERMAEAMGGVLYAAPYIPRPSALTSTENASLALTSVGLAGVRTISDERMREVADTLREASYIGVRDPRSSGVLDALDIEHELAPDFAHTISQRYTPAPASDEYILVHLPQAAIEAHGAEAWRRAIVDLADAARTEVRLFLAGTAPGHDSVDGVTALAADCRQRGAHVTVSSARAVYPRIDEIAGARLWIGSSLHGRIVAESYGVPRVSLRKSKVDAYAEYWDPMMPYGLDPAGVADAAREALRSSSGRERPGAHGVAASESIEMAVEALQAPAVRRLGGRRNPEKTRRKGRVHVSEEIPGVPAERSAALRRYGLDAHPGAMGSLGVAQEFRWEGPTRTNRAAFAGACRFGAFSYAADGGFWATDVGRYCSIGASAHVGHFSHPMSWLSTNPFQYQRSFRIATSPEFAFHDEYTQYSPTARNNQLASDVTRARTAIGNDVWMGFGVQVMPGVTIGDGAVLAAGAVVTKDVEPYTIVGGVPAKVIGRRFADDIVAELLDLAWWKFAPWQLEGVEFSDIRAAISGVRALRDRGEQEYAPQEFSLKGSTVTPV